MDVFLVIEDWVVTLVDRSLGELWTFYETTQRGFFWYVNKFRDEVRSMWNPLLGNSTDDKLRVESPVRGGARACVNFDDDFTTTEEARRVIDWRGPWRGVGSSRVSVSSGTSKRGCSTERPWGLRPGVQGEHPDSLTSTFYKRDPRSLDPNPPLHQKDL